MRKYIAAVLLTLAVGLTACSNYKAESETNSKEETSTQSAAVSEESSSDVLVEETSETDSQLHENVELTETISDEDAIALVSKTVTAMQKNDIETIVDTLDVETFYYEEFGSEGTREDMIKLLKESESKDNEISVTSLPKEYDYSFNSAADITSNDPFCKAFERDYAEKNGYAEILDAFKIDGAKRVSFTLSYAGNSVEGDMYLIHINDKWKVDLYYTLYAEYYDTLTNIDLTESNPTATESR